MAGKIRNSGAKAVLRKGQGREFKAGGAWIYDNEIDRVEGSFENGDIIELPIVSFPIVRLLKYLSFTRIKSILLNRKSAKATFSAKTASSNGRNLGLINKISFFFI